MYISLYKLYTALKTIIFFNPLRNGQLPFPSILKINTSIVTNTIYFVQRAFCFTYLFFYLNVFLLYWSVLKSTLKCCRSVTMYVLCHLYYIYIKFVVIWINMFLDLGVKVVFAGLVCVFRGCLFRNTFLLFIFI